MKVNDVKSDIMAGENNPAMKNGSGASKSKPGPSKSRAKGASNKGKKKLNVPKGAKV